jgi:hypothetical protein
MPKSSFHWPTTRPQDVAYELGDEFVEYCLNLSQVPIGESGLSGAQSNVLGEIMAIVSAMRSLPEPMRANYAASALTEVTGGGLARPHDWRNRCGGVLVGPAEVDDHLQQALLAVGFAAHPYKLLAERYVRGSTFSFAGDIIPQNQRVSLANLVLADDDLAKLFGEAQSGTASPSNMYSTGGQLYFSNGHGFAVSPYIMSQDLLYNAFSRTLLLEERASFQTFEGHLATILAEARSLARGETVQELRFLGLHGVQVDSAVKIGSLIVRPSRPTDAAVFRSVPTAGQATAVLQIEAPLKILDMSSAPISDSTDFVTGDPFERTRVYDTVVKAARRDLDTVVDRFRLACALSSQDMDSMVAPSVLSEAGLNPLTSSNGLSYRMLPVPFFSSVKIDGVRAQKAKGWLDLLEIRESPSIKVAGRRLLTAITERTDPIDALIDALIVWESLLGTGSEVSFRVPGALAVLLEPVDMAARKVVFRELRRLYGLRSRVVHGSETVDFGEALEHKQRACEIALAAVQAVVRTGVLAPMKAEERSNHLLLGF